MRGATILLAAIVLASCGPVTIPPTVELDPRELPDVHLVNGSTLDVTVTVNGTNYGVLRAEETATIEHRRLPNAPWDIEVRSPAGRLILGNRYDAESLAAIAYGSQSSAGYGPMVCGTVVVYVGAPPETFEPDNAQDPCGP